MTALSETIPLKENLFQVRKSYIDDQGVSLKISNTKLRINNLKITRKLYLCKGEKGESFLILYLTQLEV